MKNNIRKYSGMFVGITSTALVIGIIVYTTADIIKKFKEPIPDKRETITQAKKIISPAQITEASKPFVNPPLKGKDIPFKSQLINTDSGGSFTYNRSKIIIPAGIFCDEKGNTIKGKVDIKYREFHNPIEFFLSGIPMTYDSAGKQYTFESAGMFDIRGEQNGRQVTIKPGKSIYIEMESGINKGNYNIYYLDTVNKKWSFETKDRKDTLTKVNIDLGLTLEQLVNIKNEMTDLNETKPFAPRLSNPQHMTFHIKANKKDFPSLVAYENILFEVDDKQGGFQRNYGNKNWDSMAVNRVAGTDKYIIHLSNEDISCCFMIYPVFDKKDYATALKIFNKKQAEYSAGLNKVKQEAGGKIDINNTAALDANIAMMEARVQNTTECMFRYFNVSNFGYWNSDRPENMPQGAALAATYLDDKKDSLTGLDIYLVEKNKPILYIVHPGHYCQFNPDAVNFAWCITNDNTIAVFTPEDFKKINQTSGAYTFTFKLTDKKMSSNDDVQSLLESYL